MQEAGAHRHGLLRTDAVSGGEPPRGSWGSFTPSVCRSLIVRNEVRCLDCAGCLHSLIPYLRGRDKSKGECPALGEEAEG